MKKTLLVDMSHLGDFNGFGEIAKHYAPRLARAELSDIRLIMMVPERFVGHYGNNIEYITKEHPARDLRRLGVHVDLWHSTDQMFRFRRLSKDTIALFTIHDLNFLKEKTGVHLLRHWWQMRWRVYRSDYITTISEFAKADLLAHVNTGERPVKVIYNGIEDTENPRISRPVFVSDGDKFFFTIGQIRKKKNFQTLVPMMRYFPDYKLYICGDDHFHYTKTLRSIIESMGEGRVVLTGKITDEEKNWLYAHAEAFLFPSKFEGFGIPVLEAMRFGCKVFSSRMSSLPEICGDHAGYFDCLEPEAMAVTVREGLKKWDKNGVEAQEAKAYSEGFNYDVYTQQYLELYRKLLAKGK